MQILAVMIRGIVRFFTEADIVLFVLSVASAIYGLILISSVTGNVGNEVSVQVGAFIIGIVLFVLFSYIDVDIIADKSKLLFLFSMLFLSTLWVWGVGEGVGAGRGSWLRFGVIGVQPAEVVKVPFIIIMARIIVSLKERRTFNSFFSIIQIAVVFATFVVIILVIARDLGTSVVYFGILALMLFTAGMKLRWFLIAAVVIVIATPFVWESDAIFSDLQRDRILAPFIPDVIDPTGTGVLWQPMRSFEAIATGGVFGQGLGNGRLAQSVDAMPAHHTDFIFSVAGEELGFMGCMAIIALLIAIIVRCIFVGIKSNNPLGLLVCVGVASLLFVHMFMNIGMALAIMPTIGVPLPFFSYGGSSIVTCFAAMGIVSGIKMRPKPVRFRHL